VIGPGKGSGDEPYAHSADEECVIVLSGRLDVTIGSESHRLDSGDSLLIDPRQGHSFHNFTEEPAVVLWVMTPSVY
jgi:mannose-6-phosphate isomerase-like protein (cupin superfamily)